MTDRELLEMAAKAAGIYAKWPAPDYEVQWNGIGLWCSGMGHGELWNPLTVDGDALRLAVKLGIEIIIDRDIATTTTAFSCGGCGRNTFEEWGPLRNGSQDDPYAATRRAIVRAAAEIGKAML